MTTTDTALEQEILRMLEGGSSMISPNEAARRMGRGWRSLTERARDAARRLAARGHVEFVQGDRVVDASSAKGPIQLRACKSPAG